MRLIFLPSPGAVHGATTTFRPGGVTVATWRDLTPNDSNATYIGFPRDGDGGGFWIDPAACRPTQHPIPLSPAGLPKRGVFTARRSVGFTALCDVGGRVDARFSVTLEGGAVVSALVAVRSERNPRAPIAFVRWTAHAETAYLSPNCH